MKKKICFLMIFVLMMSLLSACSHTNPDQTKRSASSTPKNKTVTITDLTGRQVKIDVPVNRVVAIGPGALRLVCYANGADKVVGIENFEKKSSSVTRPYILAYPQLKNLPIIGQGGKPDYLPNAEQIIDVKPDVIFVAYLTDKNQADALQDRTNIPVVVLSYGKLSTFDKNVYTSLQIIGKVIGEEKRANEVVDYLEKCQQDLNDRIKNISNDKKPRVYVGAIGNNGIESSQCKYPPFIAVNAENVVDETGKIGHITVDKEKLLKWDPDFIFLDAAGLSFVKEDYKKNPQFYQSLKAFKNEKVYSQIPFNYYTTNIDNAIADAYWTGKVLYPEQFKDIKPEEKANEIYKMLLKKPLYKDISEKLGGFEQLNFK
ncbi:iron ABC transporter substrate-binding protein [Aceticella autotrophica]|uniref:Iron ABC transporter substrate-binding protein n=1 Tax=Aceticella autotrophica TaxID=2755338 RepID=A0A975GBH9_9THEO|nr:iron ABC transporter substrate-binding protein [Aceticella autotrophica]QSZ28181.1 iron ABC transporter substrate-binding protein [Aceticella autotrophica]